MSLVSAVTLQCSGPDNKLERAVGVLLKVFDDESVDVNCPFYYKGAGDDIRSCYARKGCEGTECVYLD